MPLKLLRVLALLLIASPGCDTDDGPMCTPPKDGSAIPMVDHAQWRVAETAEDPFAQFRPSDDISCAPEAREVEEFADTASYSIETAGCGYTTVVQPLQADACAGDVVYILLWHYPLTAPADAQAHIAIQIGDDELWAKTLDIPSESGLFEERVTVDRTYREGTEVFLHVRNHGDNSYNLLTLNLER